jgi:hypothetical protein
MTEEQTATSETGKEKGATTEQFRLYEELAQLDTLIDEEIEFHHQANSQPVKPYETAPVSIDLLTCYQETLKEIEGIKLEIAGLEGQESEYRKMNQTLLRTIEVQEQRNAALRQERVRGRRKQTSG